MYRTFFITLRIAFTLLQGKKQNIAPRHILLSLHRIKKLLHFSIFLSQRNDSLHILRCTIIRINVLRSLRFREPFWFGSQNDNWSKRTLASMCIFIIIFGLLTIVLCYSDPRICMQYESNRTHRLIKCWSTVTMYKLRLLIYTIIIVNSSGILHKKKRNCFEEQTYIISHCFNIKLLIRSKLTTHSLFLHTILNGLRAWDLIHAVHLLSRSVMSYVE